MTANTTRPAHPFPSSACPGQTQDGTGVSRKCCPDTGLHVSSAGALLEGLAVWGSLEPEQGDGTQGSLSLTGNGQISAIKIAELSPPAAG